MELEANISWIKSEINKIKDPLLLESLKVFLLKRKKEVVQESDLKIYNREIDQAIEDVDQGRTHTMTEMEERILSWQKK